MKQMIVLVAMVILGVAIATLVLGFGDSAEVIAGAADAGMEEVFEVTLP